MRFGGAAQAVAEGADGPLSTSVRVTSSTQAVAAFGAGLKAWAEGAGAPIATPVLATLESAYVRKQQHHYIYQVY